MFPCQAHVVNCNNVELNVFWYYIKKKKKKLNQCFMCTNYPTCDGRSIFVLSEPNCLGYVSMLCRCILYLDVINIYIIVFKNVTLNKKQLFAWLMVYNKIICLGCVEIVANLLH